MFRNEQRIGRRTEKVSVKRVEKKTREKINVGME
jgi:hypothetical protein